MLPRLIILSSEQDLEDEISLVNELFCEGMELFHLRKPSWEIDRQRKFLENISPEFLGRISVHQHKQCISEFDLKYFHVKELERKKEIVKPAINLISSSSFHYYDSLKKDAHRWDYCFLSPLFDSISKKGYSAAVPNDLRIENKIETKIFGLGGITGSNINQVFERGFYGAAVCGTIWKEQTKSIKIFKELFALCNLNVHTY